MTYYIFDVDGTLTPSRGQMDTEFANWFEHFATHNACYLVTGSDREKTLEQIPEHIYNLCMVVYQCNGNHAFSGQKEIYKNNWKPTDKQWQYLLHRLHNSSFSPKTGKHIEVRPGLCNFSVVGRNATTEDRKNYVVWDTYCDERESIQAGWQNRFKDTMCTIAGETGLDIYPKGFGKEQILKYFKDNQDMHFFGDKTYEGGNDHDIAQAIKKNGGNVYQVYGWQDTWECLQGLTNVV